jgi:hypothetical protein
VGNRRRWRAAFVKRFCRESPAAIRLSAPVKKLALDSKENRENENALKLRSLRLPKNSTIRTLLRRCVHQLKSPVTVFRVGLESLLGREDFKPQVY